MQTTTVEAIVIGRKNWGEADRLVFIYSKEFGKIKFVAKGSRKLKSKMAAHIEPFTVGHYGFIEGKGYPILTQAESISQNYNLSKDLDSYSKAAYICELLNLFFEENQINTEIYSGVVRIFSHLNTLDHAKRDILIRYFEYLLLETSGYKPNYLVCKKCNQNLTEKEYYFGDFEGVVCCECTDVGRKIDLNTFKMLRLFETHNINKIIAIQNAQQYNTLLGEVISPYLYDILPKIPKSKELYETKC